MPTYLSTLFSGGQMHFSLIQDIYRNLFRESVLVFSIKYPIQVVLVSICPLFCPLF